MTKAKVKVKVNVTRRERAKKDADKNIRKKVRIYRRRIARDDHDISSPVAVINKTDVEKYTPYIKRKQSYNYRPSRDITHTYKGVSYDDTQFLNVDDNKPIVIRKRDANNIFQKLFGNPVVYSVAGSNLHNIQQPTTTISNSGHILISEPSTINIPDSTSKPKRLRIISVPKKDAFTNPKYNLSSYEYSSKLHGLSEAEYIKDDEEYNKLIPILKDLIKTRDVLQYGLEYDTLKRAATKGAKMNTRHPIMLSEDYSKYIKEDGTITVHPLEYIKDHFELIYKFLNKRNRKTYPKHAYEGLVRSLSDPSVTKPINEQLVRHAIEELNKAIKGFKQDIDARLNSDLSAYRDIREGRRIPIKNDDKTYDYKYINVDGSNPEHIIRDILYEHIMKSNPDIIKDYAGLEISMNTLNENADKNDAIKSLLEGMKDSLYTAWLISHKRFPVDTDEHNIKQRLRQSINRKAGSIVLHRLYNASVDDIVDDTHKNIDDVTIHDIMRDKQPNIEDNIKTILSENDAGELLGTIPFQIYKEILSDDTIRTKLSNIHIKEYRPAVVNGEPLVDDDIKALATYNANIEDASDLQRGLQKDLLNEYALTRAAHISSSEPIIPATIKMYNVVDSNNNDSEADDDKSTVDYYDSKYTVELSESAIPSDDDE